MGVNTMRWAIVATLAMAAPAWAQDAPPPSEEATRIVSLVDKAAALLESQGRAAAFAKFRTRNSDW